MINNHVDVQQQNHQQQVYQESIDQHQVQVQHHQQVLAEHSQQQIKTEETQSNQGIIVCLPF